MTSKIREGKVLVLLEGVLVLDEEEVAEEALREDWKAACLVGDNF